MSTTVEGFLTGYPEFQPLHEEDEAGTLIAAVLARAERRFGDQWTGDVRDDVVYLQAAHMLACTPMGRNAQLSAKDGGSIYKDELCERKRAFACGRSRAV